MTSRRPTKPQPSFQKLVPGEVQLIERTAHLDGTVHQWSQNEIDALTLALAARRPLLVRGEPGTGKTQLARAAANHLGWALHAVTIHPRFEASDLLYRFDAVKRLSDAQAREANLVEENYWEPGPLWKAFDWETASRYGTCRGKAAPKGHVVLLDEIDKADSDVPNSLLDVLGQRAFEIAPLSLQFGSPSAQQPLIVITTNEERELPPAFLRRCIVLNLEPDSTVTYAEWLVQRGSAHFGGVVAKDRLIAPSILRSAAGQLVRDRHNAVSAGLPPPGLAEYIDLLNALHELAPANKSEQERWMKRLSAYAFIKHRKSEGFPEIDQARSFQGGESGSAKLPKGR